MSTSYTPQQERCERLAASMHQQAVAALPQPLQAMLRAHRHGGRQEKVELLGELHVQILKNARRVESLTFAGIFARARAQARKFTKDLCHHAAELDEQLIDAGSCWQQVKQGPRADARDATAAVAERLGKGLRQARRVIAAQREKAAVQGDFFGAGGVA